MAYYFGGNMQAMWDRSSSLVVGTTLAGTFDAAVVGSSVLIPAGAFGLTFHVGMPLVSGGPSLTSKVYGHYEMAWTDSALNSAGGFNTQSNLLRVVNSTGQVVFKVQGLGNPFPATFQCQFWNGSAFVNVGPEFNLTLSGLSTYDFSFLPGASGTFELRVNGSATPVVSVSGMNAAVNNLAAVEIPNPSAGSAYISQGILADFDLRGAKFVSQRPTGNGFHTDGTGGFDDVDDTVTVDTTGIGLPVVGNRKSFLHDNLITSGMVIDAVFINSATAVSGGTVNNLRGIVRRAGTTSNTSNVAPAPVLGIEQRSVIAEIDPTTGLAWTVANFNASEIGVEARG
jgi:hypothetical protein